MNTSTAWALVGAQFGLLIGLLVLPAGDLWEQNLVSGVVAGILIAVGVAVSVAGGLRLGGGLTPLPIPKDGQALVTSGIYRFVRHPIYSGILSLAAGLVVWGASAAHIIGWMALFLVLSIKASGEEVMLLERHEEYAHYKKTSGRLLPKFSHINDAPGEVSST
jgi:protein-S-isoprenylcysteine O-methyltransferase Ste14